MVLWSSIPIFFSHFHFQSSLFRFFVPLLPAMDDHKADLSGAFYIGQSVRCNIVDIARLQSLGSDGFDLKWIEGFNIGSVIEAKDIGVVVSFDEI
ncbi:hypothetical protein ES319_D05G289000v1 [Gossypium barbadense]|uniref:S1 motif domain-containing protein n=1 Tax=Gossypium barbadense TaxID=3634 RepID=A0A5J5RI55_GOSBA|nr:hypothetical protein ES319_D05G289000v1 [Gossypium barbadense]